MENQLFTLVIESPEEEVFQIGNFALMGKHFANTVFIETPEDISDEEREITGMQLGELSKKTGLNYIMIPAKYRVFACRLGEAVSKNVEAHRN